MARKNVLFLINSICFGGAEKQVVSLLNGLERELFNLSLIYLKPKETLLSSVQIKKMCHISSLEIGKGLEAEGVRRLARLLNKLQIDVIVCTNEFPLLYAILARLLSGRINSCSIIEVFHTTELRGTYEVLKMSLVYRWLFKLASKIIFVSSRQMNYWVDKGVAPASRSICIHNGIDIEYFRDQLSPEKKMELRSSLGISPKEYVLGICAVLREEKKHLDLLRAAQVLESRGVLVKVLIIGDGPRRKDIEMFVKANDMAENVIITGFQSDVRPFLSISNVICLVSHKVETFSIALLEALAMGKPVVSSNIGGASEIVKHGRNGFLFERGEITDLANILEMLSDLKLQLALGMESRRMAEKKFSMGEMLRKYESVFLT